MNLFFSAWRKQTIGIKLLTDYSVVIINSFVQIMACRLAGAKPLSEPMLEYCYLDPWEQTSVQS